MFIHSNDLYSCASRYVCVTDGCPDAGSTAMACKEGYQKDAPLCALCEPGWFKKLSTCQKCEDPLWVEIVLAGFALFVGILLLLRSSYKHRKVLSSSGAFTYFKILVAFVTVSSTIDTQFGVIWPKLFQQAIAALQVLTFDIGMVSGMFCIWDFSFYDSLLWQTFGLTSVTIAIFVAYQLLRSCLPEEDLKARDELKRSCMFIAIYFLAFSYPVVRYVLLLTDHNVYSLTFLC